MIASAPLVPEFSSSALPTTTSWGIPSPFPSEESENQAYEIAFSEEAWNAFGKELSEEDQRKVDELQKIDKNTRTHEQAHLAAAGGYARGGAQYNFVTGPDGKRYANGGHVDLDVGKEKTPEETLRKADVVRRAALAPADPSSADRQIAAQASKMKMEAQRELQSSDSADAPVAPASVVDAA